MWLASIMTTIIRSYRGTHLTMHSADRASGERLTTVAHKPSIVIEQATSSYSFRFSELSQPI
jgi:competence transcription factor ComK